MRTADGPQIRDFLRHMRLAVIGVSRNSKDFSRTLFQEFIERGYDAIPVHPDLEAVEGRPCFHRPQDISPPIDTALLMTSPAVTEQVVKDCAEADIDRIWMYRASPAAVEYCRSKAIDVIADECPLMFFRDAGFFPHRLHGLIRKIAGTYPK
jgi:predicted CoA-binding protein